MYVIYGNNCHVYCLAAITLHAVNNLLPNMKYLSVGMGRSLGRHTKNFFLFFFLDKPLNVFSERLTTKLRIRWHPVWTRYTPLYAYVCTYDISWRPPRTGPRQYGSL